MLFLILAVFAVFVYFASFRGMIIWPLMVAELPLVAIFYVITSVVTEKMIRKQRGDETFMYVKASMISSDSANLLPGALTITKSEIIFYSRKSAGGGVMVSWSCSVPEVSEYNLGKVDGFHKGVSFTLTGREEPQKFVSNSIQKREGELKSALGWDS